jgi:hypothetical protein
LSPSNNKCQFIIIFLIFKNLYFPSFYPNIYTKSIGKLWYKSGMNWKWRKPPRSLLLAYMRWIIIKWVEHVESMEEHRRGGQCWIDLPAIKIY